MTCQQAVPLLDDYLDGEMASPQAAELERHLATCPACTEELESSRKLRELLKQSREGVAPAEPRSDYWVETESLILARTVESGPMEQPEPVVARQSYPHSGNSQVVRSFLLFAASLVLMVASIYLGTKRNELGHATIIEDSPVLISSGAAESYGTSGGLVLTKEEKTCLVRGMFALGAPGPVGRYTTIADLLGSY